MHRLATMPGGWESGVSPEGVIFIEQTAAPMVMLTAADTDIQVLATAIPQLPSGFPALRVVNLLQLQQQLTIDTYADEVLSKAQVIILRLLGGRAYWSYGLEVVKDLVTRIGATLFVLPGDDRPDPDLVSHSNVPLSIADQLWRYFTEGGVDNSINALKFVAHKYLDFDCVATLPQAIPRIGYYRQPGSNSQLRISPTDGLKVRNAKSNTFCVSSLSSPSPQPSPSSRLPKVGILFYRAHHLAGNTDVIDALCAVLQERGLDTVPVFAQSLQDPGIQAELVQTFTTVPVGWY